MHFTHTRLLPQLLLLRSEGWTLQEGRCWYHGLVALYSTVQERLVLNQGWKSAWLFIYLLGEGVLYHVTSPGHPLDCCTYSLGRSRVTRQEVPNAAEGDEERGRASDLWISVRAGWLAGNVVLPWGSRQLAPIGSGGRNRIAPRPNPDTGEWSGL